MEFPYVKQKDTTDCGAACLRMVALYYGQDYPLSYLTGLCSPTAKGISLQNLTKAAGEIGFLTLAVKTNLEKLKQSAHLPLIAHWNNNHYIVVYEVNDLVIFTSCPSLGLLTYSFNDFLAQWIGPYANPYTEEGIALMLEPKRE